MRQYWWVQDFPEMPISWIRMDQTVRFGWILREHFKIDLVIQTSNERKTWIH